MKPVAGKQQGHIPPGRRDLPAWKDGELIITVILAIILLILLSAISF